MNFGTRLANLINRNLATVSMILTVVALAFAGVITWGQVLIGFGLFSGIFIAILVIRSLRR